MASLITAADPTAPTLAGLTVALLLYADDLTLLSTTPEGLQRQLDALHSFCEAAQLDVNLTKTEIVVFNPPRIISAANRRRRPPTWHLNGNPINTTTTFRYLGITFDAKKGITTAPTHLFEAGQRALHALWRRCAELKITTPAILCNLFDSLVAPVLSYACEAWAFATPAATRLRADAETLHRRFLRRAAGMHPTSLDAAVYAEYYRSPLANTWRNLAIKFIVRLARLPEDRLAHHALLEALSLEQQGQHTGLGALRDHLASTGISAATLEQLAAIDANTAAAATNRRWSTVDWPALLKPKLRPDGTATEEGGQRLHYRSLCPAFPTAPQPYLSSDCIPSSHRHALTRFRCGTHWLATHTSCYRAATIKYRQHKICCRSCHNILLCSHCNSGWHCQCLNPPLPSPPDTEHWYCPPCTENDRCTPDAALAEAAATSRACPHCTNPVEDVPHFLFHCPFYEPCRSEFRDLFLPHATTCHATWLAQPDTPRIAAFLHSCYKLNRETAPSPS